MVRVVPKLVLGLLLGACSVERGRPEPTGLGPDCSALRSCARRAAACDQALADLAEALALEHDEVRCRRAARALIAMPRAEAPRIRSVFEAVDRQDGGPLGAAEHARLASLPLPAEIVLMPDLAPGPGVPPTSATVADTSLEADERGRLRGYVGAGAHTLRVRHAGEEKAYCLDLGACDHLAITTHGPRLAAHPRARPGPCASSAQDRADAVTGAR